MPAANYETMAMRTFFARNICERYDWTARMCAYLQEQVCGMASRHLSLNLASERFSHFPAGMSTKLITHMSQMFSGNREFAPFDYGEAKNLAVYGTSKPYSYPLEKVTAPTALITAPLDGYAVRQDMDTLISRLPNVIMDYQVPKPDFNHVDLGIGADANEYVNIPVINKMNELL